MYTNVIITKIRKERSPFSMDVMHIHRTKGRDEARALDRKYIRAIAGKVKASVDRDMDRIVRSLRISH